MNFFFYVFTNPKELIFSSEISETLLNLVFNALPSIPQKNSCFRTCFHSSFPENLTMTSRQFVLHLFFSDILSLRYPDTNQIWISVRYDGWGIFPGVINIFTWPCKVMSCLAHLAGGPIVIDSFSAMLSILPWGNCKTYSTSCS